MRSKNTVKTIKTVCGKTITYLQVEGEVNKAHSTEGPAIVYPESEGIAPEYYLYGIKYTKTRWRELVSQTKVAAVPDMILPEIPY